MRCVGRRQSGHVRLAQEVDQEAADTDFTTHVQEDRHHPQGQVTVLERVRKRALLAALLRIDDFRQARQREQDRQQQQRGGQGQVRALHGRGLRGVVRLQLVGAQLRQIRRAQHAAGQDQHPAQERRHSGAQRVEGLGQRQAAGCGARIAQHRHVRIGRHLQNGDAARQHEEAIRNSV
ncbi:conserved hypothetical protein [Ricinus communis]|uniref:Uncharacterized protein n=1 Tax=Ricinus communis TaxID=3988 RepID=B9TF47_RICCO|nr:conserved hypothetical protein [Ricinus communis]